MKLAIVILIAVATYALLNAASKADDHAEIMRDFKEEK